MCFWLKLLPLVVILLTINPALTMVRKLQLRYGLGSLANYSQLRVFICISYAHVGNSILESRAIKSIFLG
jgi:hypothetical protein